MSNITRWVQRVDGVAKVKTNLNTGKANVWFEEDQPPKLSKLWKAVKDVGFRPTRIESGGKTYRQEKGGTDLLTKE